MKLASIEYDQGNVKESLRLCDLAIEGVHKTRDPKLNRADIAYCVKATILMKENEAEKAIDVLNRLKSYINYDDPYATLLKAKIAYEKSVALRSVNILEQSKLLKIPSKILILENKNCKNQPSTTETSSKGKKSKQMYTRP